MMSVFHCKNVKAKRKRDPKLPWITKGLLKSINHKNNVKCPSNNKQQKFKIWKTINNVIGRAQKQTLSDQFKLNNLVSGRIIQPLLP